LRSLKLEPVYFNTELSNKVIDYLKNQKYIKFKKINIFLRNNFSKIHPYGFIIVDKNCVRKGILKGKEISLSCVDIS